MMNKYSEKEIQIFSGVLKLAGQGLDLSRITARQIADAAGMGKATIYDYFPSKEEIISKAMFYSIEMQKQRFEKAVSCTADFKSKMMCVYDGVINSVENSSSMFNMVMAAKSGKAAEAFHKDGRSCPLEGAVKEFFRVIYQIIDCGRKESCIKSETDRIYTDMVIIGNLFAVGKEAKEGRTSHRQIKDKAFEMLVKALS